MTTERATTTTTKKPKIKNTTKTWTNQKCKQKISQPKVTDALTRSAECCFILEHNLPCNSNNRNAFWVAYIQFYSK